MRKHSELWDDARDGMTRITTTVDWSSDRPAVRTEVVSRRGRSLAPAGQDQVAPWSAPPLSLESVAFGLAAARWFERARRLLPWLQSPRGLQ